MKIMLFTFLLLNLAQADVGVVTCRPATNCIESSNSPVDGCNINAGSWCDVTATSATTNNDECRRVTNYRSDNVFIPAKSGTGDWMSFVNTDTSGFEIIKGTQSSCSTGTVHCEASGVYWTVNGKTCTGNVPGPRNFSTVENSSDGTAPTTGGASFLCSNGSWFVQGGASCVESCTATTLSWGGNCSAAVADTGNGGTSTANDDNSGPYMGSANYNCNNGAWELQSGSSCQPTTTYAWITDGWGACNGSGDRCGNYANAQSRGVYCRGSDGNNYSDSNCSGAGAKPASQQSCDDVSGCHWRTDGWGACSATCGSGTQNRGVYCQGANNTDLPTSQFGYCDAAASRPGSSQSCTGTSCGDEEEEWDLDQSCFVAGTAVTMADGSWKKIEEVLKGEIVKTFDEHTQKYTVSPVVKVFHHKEKKSELYRFTLEGGKTITSNDIHPYYIIHLETYMEAKSVYGLWQGGEELQLLDQDNNKVKIIHIEKSKAKVKLYNIHVQSKYDEPAKESDIGHNYFANGVLVHNKTTDGYPPTPKSNQCCQNSGSQVDYLTCRGTKNKHDTYNACMAGGCHCGHPMAWSQSGNNCVEYASPPQGFTYTDHMQGDVVTVHSGYCSSGQCYGSLTYRCDAGGACTYLTPSCRDGQEP